MPNGFLVGPAKEPGPQPVTIQNLGAKPQTFSLHVVSTTVAGDFCAPTSKPVPWFTVASRVTVPAHKTVSLPVHVQGRHSVTDVAVRVSPVIPAGHHVAVAEAAYAQEIIGGLHGSGCAHIHGVAAATPSDPPASSLSGLDVGVAAAVAVAVVLVLVVTLARRMLRASGRHA
jgi:hypothetical protein